MSFGRALIFSFALFLGLMGPVLAAQALPETVLITWDEGGGCEAYFGTQFVLKKSGPEIALLRVESHYEPTAVFIGRMSLEEFGIFWNKLDRMGFLQLKNEYIVPMLHTGWKSGAMTFKYKVDGVGTVKDVRFTEGVKDERFNNVYALLQSVSLSVQQPDARSNQVLKAGAERPVICRDVIFDRTYPVTVRNACLSWLRHEGHGLSSEDQRKLMDEFFADGHEMDLVRIVELMGSYNEYRPPQGFSEYQRFFMPYLDRLLSVIEDPDTRYPDKKSAIWILRGCLCEGSACDDRYTSALMRVVEREWQACLGKVACFDNDSKRMFIHDAAQIIATGRLKTIAFFEKFTGDGYPEDVKRQAGDQIKTIRHWIKS